MNAPVTTPHVPPMRAIPPPKGVAILAAVSFVQPEPGRDGREHRLRAVEAVREDRRRAIDLFHSLHLPPK